MLNRPITNMARLMLKICDAAERYGYCEVDIKTVNGEVSILIETSFGQVGAVANTMEEAALLALVQWPSDED